MNMISSDRREALPDARYQVEAYLLVTDAQQVVERAPEPQTAMLPGF